MDFPEDLKALFVTAEAELTQAKEADVTLVNAEDALSVATETANTAAADALIQHQEANAAATEFVAAIKTHFGL